MFDKSCELITIFEEGVGVFGKSQMIPLLVNLTLLWLSSKFISKLK